MADVKLYTLANPVVTLTGVTALGTEEIRSASVATGKVLQNGMFVKFDPIKGEATLPAKTDEVWLHASVEKTYGVHETMADFKVEAGKGFMARVYRLRKGMEFETNAVIYDTAVLADVTAIKNELKTGAVYAIPDTTGLLRLVKAIPTADAPVAYAQVKEVIALPNGEIGVAVEVVKVA